MKIENHIIRIGGTVVLTTSLLAQYINPAWNYVTMAVGAILLQSTFTGFCPMKMILQKFKIGE